MKWDKFEESFPIRMSAKLPGEWGGKKNNSHRIRNFLSISKFRIAPKNDVELYAGNDGAKPNMNKCLQEFCGCHCQNCDIYNSHKTQ